MNLPQTIESREVARMLGMRHDNLLQKIKSQIDYMNEDPELKVKVGDFFIQSEYFDRNNQLRICYLVTKIGCDFLGSSFQGQQGNNFRVRYISHFGSNLPVGTEQPLKVQLQALLNHEEKLDQLETDVVFLKNEIDLTRQQKKKLSDLVKHNVMKAVGGKKSQAYKELYRVGITEHWREIKNYFGVASYEEIPKLRFNESLELAKCWSPSAELALEIKQVNNQQLQIA